MLETHLLGFQAIRGPRVSLLRRAPEHAKFLRDCWDDKDFMALYRLAQNRREGIAQIRKRLAREYKKLPKDLRKFEWVIERNATPSQEARLIGLAAIADYQPSHQRGEFLIGILDPEEQKTGVGLEASLLVLDFAFNVVKLHKFMSFVYGHNQASQNNTQHLGFIQEALLREHIYYQSHGYVDMYQNGMLESDFRGNRRLSRLSRRILKRDITQEVPEPKVLPDDYLKQAEQQFKAALQKNTA
ncbi:GNAT family N-acetyltransferase [Candidatus Venteria ishoeyi]|uniref:N-acetyltransferase domain-containing protein n=1 Tax=Candidatus Venteria ishoeyi TaxID=1899563 RepID=A0A1H6FGA3_9GAMM|nr:GNAT family protein [Candidatus Venteria ishoeyi]MDM8546484.1 GNAT family protein [Candidatus Venteria ishoeyi]SEH08065.1 Uncharacterised protein [Candidatus Venteria ishoeyi]